jgi:hypothetical protein
MPIIWAIAVNASTAQGGKYIDWSVNDPNRSDAYAKFTVYAKSAS